MVLSVGPNVNIFDLPLLPSHIVNLQGYMAWAAGVYWNLHSLIVAQTVSTLQRTLGPVQCMGCV